MDKKTLDLRTNLNPIKINKENLTNEKYKSMEKEINNEIKNNQKKYYDAYNNASKIIVGWIFYN